MGLTHLDTQGENCKYRQCTVISLRAYKPIPINNRFNPFANYRIAKGKDGQYWAEGDCPQITVKNTGHFRELPAGYEFADTIILDDSQPLHCCTVGDTDPRDANTHQLESNKVYLVPPPFKVAIKSSDIVLHAIKTTQAHTDSIRLEGWKSRNKESIFLQWCKGIGVTPEYCKSNHYITWRVKYPNIEIDPQTLKKLNFVKIGDSYHPIQELYGTFTQLPPEHPLHKYSGIDYGQIASAYVAANAPADSRIYLQNGKYCIQEGTAEFEGQKFPFFISFAACSDTDITIPFSQELLRAILKGRGEETYSLHFTPYGKIAIRDTDVCKLELSEPLMGRVASKNAVLLSKDYPNGKWKPVTRQMKSKYLNFTTYMGYKTSGEYEDRLEVYDSTQPLTPKEKRSDRINRLGLEPYKHEISVSQWSDAELLAYFDYRKKEESGEYIQIAKDDKLLLGMFSNTISSFDGLYWVAFAKDREQFLWSDFIHLLLSAGIAKIACGKIFMRKDCICIEDAITHYNEMVDGSRIKRFLEGILDLFQKLGTTRLQQLLLGRI